MALSILTLTCCLVIASGSGTTPVDAVPEFRIQTVSGRALEGSLKALHVSFEDAMSNCTDPAELQRLLQRTPTSGGRRR